MSRDEQRLTLIAHALAGSAYQSTDTPAGIARRAIAIASAVLRQLALEAEEHERGQPTPLSDAEAAALIPTRRGRH